jgi:hypothetical protein
MVDLMCAFNFTPDDLDANQHGYMTKEQRVRLRRKRWERLIPYFGLGLPLFLFLAVMMTDNFLTMSLGTCLIGPLLVSMVYLGFLDWQVVKRDLYKGDVATATGYYEVGIWDGSKAYKFTAEGITFILWEKQRLALKKGDCYRVFFTPNSKIILSIEAL